MSVLPLTINGLRPALADRRISPSALASVALQRANRNPTHNTYLWQDAGWSREEATRAEAMSGTGEGPFGDGRHALWGLPISVKDCFDLAGAPTSCGTQFYRDRDAAQDSWLVERLRAAGAVITGKTHMHALAYGITGENPEFGDCEQPEKPGSLTGGSSSGAAASVQEGSAVAAIGTDTGGSIRVPAALCGLAGYRASLGRGNWRGAVHLAPSFDTMGWLFRDLRDAAYLGEIFTDAPSSPRPTPRKFAIVHDPLLHDCEPEIVASLRAVSLELQALGLEASTIDVSWWADSLAIYAPIQAWEAAQIHAGNFDRFGPTLRDRLAWGASIPEEEIASLRKRHDDFRARTAESLDKYELLLLPASPIERLAIGVDHTKTRGRLLRYTTPFSVAGVPVVTVPGGVGGMQLAAARECDESLLTIITQLGDQRIANGNKQAAC